MSTYVIVDLETTGLTPGRNGIIEFAAMVLENGQVVDEFETLIQSFDPVTEQITEITGITQEMVDEAPSLFSVKSHMKRILGDYTLVGHNVGFDLGFLRQEKLALHNHAIDTLTLTSILFPTLGRYNLEHVSNALNLPLPEEGQAHRAMADTELTAELFMALREEALKLDMSVLSEIAEAGLRVGWPEAVFFRELISEKAKIAFTQGGNAAARNTGKTLGELFKPGKVEGKALVPKEEVEQIPAEDIMGMFEPGGNFSRVFPNFEYRPQQIEMVGAVTDAFNQGQHLLIEAGTGTGKSVGYMLPAAFWSALNGRRVVVSTNTINLQDQLVNKDVPTLQKVLPFELRTAVRKGRRNYVCTRIFQQLRHRGVDKIEEMPLYAKLLVWLPQSESGDMNEITLRNFDERMMWNRISAQNDICRQEHCTQFRCPRFVAQQRAEHAHIVIVNHALLLSDLANENHILPAFYDLIIDEAHHLEPAVTSGMSFEADKRTLDRLVNDIVRDKGGLLDQLSGQTNIIPPDMRSGLDNLISRIRSDGDLAQMRMEDFFGTLTYFLTDGKRSKSDFSQQVRLTPSIRTQPLWDEVMISWDNLAKPLYEVIKNLGKVKEAIEGLMGDYEIEDAELHLQNITSTLRGITETYEYTDAIVANPTEENIYWAELYRDRVSIHAAPLHVGPLVEEHIFHGKETVVLASATMRTSPIFGNEEPNFEHIRQRLHAEAVDELAVGSPFDYKKNALLYLISDMPEPNQPYYQQYVEQAVIDTAATLGGRTLVLFTSYKQLKETYQAIRGPLQKEGITVLAQLEGSSRQQLTDQFRSENARAVLLGTKSFWEGVDIPGDSLLAVLLVKIPFDVPSDPIFSARSETFENSFFQFSIPEAILRWRQGFGRLIRRQSDEGVVLILDKRVMSKRYGSAFIDSLPECTLIRQPSTRINELLVRWFNRKR